MSGRPFLGPGELIESVLAGDDPDVSTGYSANALVLAPSGQAGETRVCGELLSVFDDVNVLGVAVEHGPGYYERVWERHFDGSVARLGVVDVGTDAADTEHVRAVADVGDLTGIGITVTEFVRRWADADEPTVVCFDSLTPILRYTELDRAYRFLDVTTGRLDRVCAVSHAHINPLAHDEQTLQQLMGVFDAVVEPADADGDAGDDPAAGWRVRRA